MYVCWRHRQLRTLLDPTEGIGQLKISLAFWIDIGYELRITVVENDQSRTAGSVNSVRRAVYVKEAIMQMG